jgi:hypothetical protein
MTYIHTDYPENGIHTPLALCASFMGMMALVWVIQLNLCSKLDEFKKTVIKLCDPQISLSIFLQQC